MSKLLITKITINDYHYDVIYNYSWLYHKNIDQIDKNAVNYNEVKNILLYYERINKINYITNHDNNIYNDKVIYQKKIKRKRGGLTWE